MSRGVISCAHVGPDRAESIDKVGREGAGALDDPPQQLSGGVADVDAFDLNISERPSVMPPVGVLAPLDDGEGAISESARSRLG